MTNQWPPYLSIADSYAVNLPDLLARRPELADMAVAGVVVATGVASNV